MSSARGTSFTKTRACPSLQDLLLSHSSEFSSGKAARINFHLAGCDSCRFPFLFNYPTATVLFEAAEMPRYLRSLAELLLVSDRPRLRSLAGIRHRARGYVFALA
jgi:hypothetical protein